MWSVGTILNGLLSFMYENNITTGSISSSKADKKRLAAKSLEQNLKSPLFRKLFPEWVEEHRTRQKEYQVNLMLFIMVLFKGCKTSILLSDVLSSLTLALQEQEALRQSQPPQSQVPVEPVKTKHTLGSTLLTLGIVAGVIGLLLVPLLSN